MELDEMKLAWQKVDRGLDRQHAMQLRLLRDRQMDRFRGGLRPLVWGQCLELLVGAAIAIWALALWVPQRDLVSPLVCGLLMQGFGIGMIISAGRVLEIVHSIDHAAPVATIQRQLAHLRWWRVKVAAPINAIAACFVWIPALVLSLAAHGIDIWNRNFAQWALLNSLVGLVAVALVVWLLRRLGWGSRLDAHAAGSSVQKAQAALDQLAHFERE